MKKEFTLQDLYEAYEAGRTHGYYNPEKEEQINEMRQYEGYCGFEEWLELHKNKT